MVSESRLVLGDCLETMRTLHHGTVDLVLTDIPYGEVNRESGGLRNLDKGTADAVTFELAPFVAECVRVCRGSFYIFCGIEQISELASLFAWHDLTVRSGIWRKTNPSPMNGEYLWLSGHEHCVFARYPKATFTERCKSAVWDSPSLNTTDHPTEKPLRLFTRLMLASTRAGDTVLDPCMGSGTTGVACGNHGRRFIGIEKKPEWFAMAETRIAAAYAQQTLFGDVA